VRKVCDVVTMCAGNFQLSSYETHSLGKKYRHT